jgi:membrane protein
MKIMSTPPKKANLPTRIIETIDTFQQRHTVLGFAYGVLKKYGQDNGGYQAAILTYYGVLSLFPLLLVFTTLTQLLLKNDPSLRNKVATSVTHYFPVVGSQLQQAVHSPKKAGLELLVSLVITFYGARGAASALQYALSLVWYTPRVKQPAFLKNLSRSMGIIVGGGLGFVAAVVLSSYAAILGGGVGIKILATLLSTLILWGTFIVVLKLAIAGDKAFKDVAVGAAVAAIGIQILQTAGTAILAHELKGFHTEYGTFALVIGLLFWIYLQAEVILYAVEVDVVRSYHLFPRSLQDPLSDSDKLAYSKSAEATKQHKSENVAVRFRKK